MTERVLDIINVNKYVGKGKPSKDEGCSCVNDVLYMNRVTGDRKVWKNKKSRRSTSSGFRVELGNRHFFNLND